MSFGADGRRAKRGAVEPPHRPDHPWIQPISSQEEFRDRVMGPQDPVVVAFYDSEETAKTTALARELEAVAEQLHEFFPFVYIDRATPGGAELVKIFSLSQYPALVVFLPEMEAIAGQEGHLMKSSVTFNGETTARSIVRWIFGAISLTHLENVATLQDVAEFLSKHASFDLPHFLYVTNQSVPLSPTIVALSHRYHYGAVFATAVASSAPEVVAHYQIRKFPAFLAITPRGPAEDEVLFMRTAAPNTTMGELVEFMSQWLPSPERQRQLIGPIHQEEVKLREKEREHAKIIKALDPVIIRKKSEWKKKCLKRSRGFCLVLFQESVETDVPMEMLTNVSKKFAAKSTTPLQIVVVDGLANHALLSYFGVINGLPDMLFIQPQKKMYLNFVGSISEKGVLSFLDKAMKSSGKRLELRSVPKYRRTPPKAREERDSGAPDEISDEL